MNARAPGTLVRPARDADAAAIAAIYTQGIEDRIATFETRPRTAEEMTAWLAAKAGRHPVVVAERGGRVVAWAAADTYRPRECYDGVAECSVYAARDARRTGGAGGTDRGLRGGGLLEARVAHLPRERCEPAALRAARVP